MKKLFTFVSTLLVGASLSLAQAAQGTGTTATSGQPSAATAPSGTTAKAHKKHHHKMGHKHKKSAGTAAMPAANPQK